MSMEWWSHPQSIVESETIGARTRVWAFAHVMKGARIGADCNIGEHVFVESGAVVGDRVTLKNGVQIWEGITLENDVFIGPNATLTNDRFPRSPRSAAAGERYHDKRWLENTLIREGVSIGANATILCGIEIGEYATVGAGAVVTRSVPPYSLVLGSPAKVAGLVCYCGKPLPHTLSCPYCSCSYRMDGNHVRRNKATDAKG